LYKLVSNFFVLFSELHFLHFFVYSSRINFLKSTEGLKSYWKQFTIGIVFFNIWKKAISGLKYRFRNHLFQIFSFLAYWINFYFTMIELGKSLFAFFLYKNQTKIGKCVSIIQRNCLDWKPSLNFLAMTIAWDDL
jgi:hypothetical protein